MNQPSQGLTRRAFLRATLVAAGGVLTGRAAVEAFAREPGEPLRFVMLSDTHVGSAGDAARLEQALPWVRRENPAFVLHGGDVVEHLVTNHKEVETARDALAQLRVPVHWVPGNHDVGQKNSKQQRESWAAAFGPAEQVVRHGGWNFVGFDSLAFSDTCNCRDLEEEVFAFLEGLLPNLDGRRTLLFYHVPEMILPLAGSISWTESATQRWLAFTHRLRPAAALTGHWHVGVRMPLSSHPVIVAPPISGKLQFATGYLRCSLKGNLVLCERVMIEKEDKRELPALVNWILLPEGRPPPEASDGEEPSGAIRKGGNR